MEYIYETKEYTVTELQEQFEGQFPKLVKVIQGYHGPLTEEEINTRQVLCIWTESRHERVLSRFKSTPYNEGLLSLPTTNFEKLSIVDKDGKANPETQYIHNVIKQHLPVTVQFPKNRTINEDKMSISTNNIPDIELLHKFDEDWLLGNFIYDGEMCTDIVYIPVYLSELRFSIITGIRGHTQSQWEKYNKELDHASAYVEYHETYGNINIAEYDAHAIPTNPNYTFVAPRRYTNIVNLMRRPVIRGAERNISNTRTGGGEPKPAVSIPLDYDDYGGDYEELVEFSRSESPTVLMYQELQPNVNIDKETSHKLSKLQLEEKKEKPPVPAFKPRHKLSSKNQTTPPALPKRNAKVPKPEPQGNVSHDYLNDVPRKDVLPNIHNKENPGSLDTHSVRVTTKTADPSTEQSTSKIENVPKVSSQEDVSRLTIDEMVAYLNKLELGQYAEIFRKQMIDGSLLVEMDKNIFRNEIGMTMIEAIRLDKFAREGHVPCVNRMTGNDKCCSMLNPWS